MSALRPLQMLLGICAFWPLARLLYSGYDMLISGPDPANPFQEWRPTTTLDFASLAIYVGLLIFFLAYLYGSTRVPPDKKVPWSFFLLFAGFVAMPIFWFMYFWRSAPVGEQSGP